MSEAPLVGKTIVITRPKEQAGHLAELIRQAGGEAVLFPLIEIQDPTDSQTLDERIDRLNDYDLAVFVSPTAVTRGIARITRRHTLPPTLQIAAIGQGSARELRRLGVAEVLVPEHRFDSAALLSLPEMQQMTGKRVVIFRGEGGRELLADTLRMRGATVDYAECYRRARPTLPATDLVKRALETEIHGLVITSSESLRNLLEMVGESGNAWLRTTPIFVPHPNIQLAGRDAGLSLVIVLEGGDEALLRGIITFLAKSI
ncbi:MAG: uroporphyrinogen-III synthase [Thiobacillaceae bacterium]